MAAGAKWTKGGQCPTAGVIGSCDQGGVVDYWYDGDPSDIMMVCAVAKGTYKAGTATYMPKVPTADGSGWKTSAPGIQPDTVDLYDNTTIVVEAVGDSAVSGAMTTIFHTEVGTQQSALVTNYSVDFNGTATTMNATPVYASPNVGSSTKTLVHKGAAWYIDESASTTAGWHLVIQTGGTRKVDYQENSFPGGGFDIEPDDTVYWWGMEGAGMRVSPVIQPYTHIFSPAHSIAYDQLAFQDTTTSINMIEFGLVGGKKYLFWLQSDNKLEAFKFDDAATTQGHKWVKVAEATTPQWSLDVRMRFLADKYIFWQNKQNAYTWTFANDTLTAALSNGTLPGGGAEGAEIAADANNIFLVYQDSSVGGKLTVAKITGGSVSTVGTEGFTTIGSLIPKIWLMNGVPTVVTAAGIVSPVTGTNHGNLFFMQPSN